MSEKNPTFPSAKTLIAMKIALVTLLVIMFSSCSSEGNHLVVVLEKGSNIKEGNAVILNEHKVGTVEKIELNSAYEVCVTISLNETLKLPVDSKFNVTQMDFFETVIQIEPGTSKRLLAANDSVQGAPPRDIPLDLIIETITDVIDNSKPVKNQDSILKELHNLNEEVKKLNKE
jgi:ABC-type transporter Mla subunit MlaD